MNYTLFLLAFRRFKIQVDKILSNKIETYIKEENVRKNTRSFKKLRDARAQTLKNIIAKTYFVDFCKTTYQ